MPGNLVSHRLPYLRTRGSVQSAFLFCCRLLLCVSMAGCSVVGSSPADWGTITQVYLNNLSTVGTLQLNDARSGSHFIKNAPVAFRATLYNFDFIQTEKVTDTMKARSLVAYFTTEDGEKISFDVPIVANSREDAPEKRTFHEKFTLKSREYKYGDKYYLVLADANNEKNILQQYEFMIDIAFVDDFGF